MSLLDWIELVTNNDISTDTKEKLGELKRRYDKLYREVGCMDPSFLEAEKELSEFIDRMNLAGGYDALA